MQQHTMKPKRNSSNNGEDADDDADDAADIENARQRVEVSVDFRAPPQRDEISDIHDQHSDGGASWIGRVFESGKARKRGHARRRRRKSSRSGDLVGLVDTVESYGQVQPDTNSRRHRPTLISHVPLVDLFREQRDHARLRRQTSSLSSQIHGGTRHKPGGSKFGIDHYSDAVSRTSRRRHILDAAGISPTSFQARSVALLRWAVIIVWLTAACIISLVLVKRYAEGKEEDEFQFQFKANADKLVNSFRTSTDNRLNAVNALATYITVFARETSVEFPFVTLPGFVMAGANTRISAESIVVSWLPLITDANRERWEAYAYTRRFHANRALKQDTFFRKQQDIEHGYLDAEQGAKELAKYASYAEDVYVNPPLENVTVINNTVRDGTSYHPQIWGSRDGDAPRPKGSGPYLVTWQRSPASNFMQFGLNTDAATNPIRRGVVGHILNQKKPGILFHPSSFPRPETVAFANQTIQQSQYRHDGEAYLGDPAAVVSYPIYDDYGKGNFIGVLSLTLYWRLFFINILPRNAKGYICVLQNKFNQTLIYRVDADQARFIRSVPPDEVDSLSFGFDDMVVTSEIGMDDRANARSKVETQAYTTLPIDTDYNTYTIRIYPTQETFDVYKTDDPIFYTSLVAGIFAVAAMVFLAYDFCVQKRQQLIASKAIENAQKAAAAERDLNEYIAHEVRNPLSAALSACSFVDSAVNEVRPLSDDESKQLVREDVQIINSSLTFVNELLRNLLDLHRATDRQIRIRKRQTDIFEEVLRPVASILYRRDASYELIVECCPRQLLVDTDCLRLKQVLLNLGRNASKFVEGGFLRLRAEIEGEDDAAAVGGDGGGRTDGGNGGTDANMNLDSTMDGRGQLGRSVKIYVEDSGPGIPAENRKHLFSKFKESLDVATQGAGIGPCLCKNLMDIMGGDISLDETYDSGVPGRPGTRFVIDLKEMPSEPPNAQGTNRTAGTGGAAGNTQKPARSVAFAPLHPSEAIETPATGPHGGTEAMPQESTDKTEIDTGKGSTDGLYSGDGDDNDDDRHSIVLTSPVTCDAFQDLGSSSHSKRRTMKRSYSNLSSLSNEPIDEGFEDETSSGGNSGLTPVLSLGDEEMRDISGSTSTEPGSADKGSEGAAASPSKQQQQHEEQQGDPGTDVATPQTVVTGSANTADADDAAQQAMSPGQSIFASQSPQHPSKSLSSSDLVQSALLGNSDSSGLLEASLSFDQEPPTSPRSLPAIPLSPSQNVDVSDTKTTNEEHDDAADKKDDETSEKQRSDSVPTDELPEKLSVLFVDDDKVLRKLFGRCVKRAFPDWTVKEAPDGETALQMADKGLHDLIFMDQYMSTAEKKLLGTETVEEMRRRGITSKICGLSANDVGEAFSAAGADAFICKPLSFDKARLQEQIKWIMS